MAQPHDQHAQAGNADHSCADKSGDADLQIVEGLLHLRLDERHLLRGEVGALVSESLQQIDYTRIVGSLAAHGLAADRRFDHSVPPLVPVPVPGMPVEVPVAPTVGDAVPDALCP